MSLVILSAVRTCLFASITKSPKRIFARVFHLSKDFSKKMNEIRIGVCQVCSSSVKQENLAQCQKLIQEAADAGAQMVFLPEAFDYIAEKKEDAVQMAEEISGPTITKFRELAKTLKIWISLGGFHEKLPDQPSLIGNTHVIINDLGDIKATYRKAHLFDVDIPSKGIKLIESSYVLRGSEIVNPVPTVIGNVGLAVCYDLRFPELSIAMRMKGAQVLTYPSAFTYATGELHWETLLRARAIENQTYVVAAAQVGQHNEKRRSWGHSMVVDPLGKVIACLPDSTGVITAVIKKGFGESIGEQLPVWKHRRYDLYPSMIAQPFNTEKVEDVFQFGSGSVHGNSVFLKSALSIAFTNRKCVVPGHVLVAPIRKVPRYSDLTPMEVTDLALMVQIVERAMEFIHRLNSSSVVIQDGPDAGQTVPHVHFHILPRRPGDFEINDDIYRELQGHEKSVKYGIRPELEMFEEADLIRSTISSFFNL